MTDKLTVSIQSQMLKDVMVIMNMNWRTDKLMDLINDDHKEKWTEEFTIIFFWCE